MPLRLAKIAVGEPVEIVAVELERADLWREPLVLAWRPKAPSATGADPNLAVVSRTLRAIQPDLEGRAIWLSTAGTSLAGAWQLGDGSWMTFRAAGYLDTSRPLHGHIGAVLMLVACVTILALVLARLLGRPLRKLADAADRVGREDVTPAAEEGPREVRRVAAAFNAMQARLLDQVNERIQALAAVSHDLRTPIARLRLRAANVRNQELRAAIGHDIDEMEAFMRSILDFLRGADPEEERLIDLASLVVTIVHDAQDMGSVVHYEGPASLELVTRPIKLQRAIDNLVQNAIRHAGQAEIRLSQGDDGVRIVVEDQGRVFQSISSTWSSSRFGGSKARAIGTPAAPVLVWRSSAVPSPGLAGVSVSRIEDAADYGQPLPFDPRAPAPKRRR